MAGWPKLQPFIAVPDPVVGLRIENDRLIVETAVKTYRVQMRQNRPPRLRLIGFN